MGLLCMLSWLSFGRAGAQAPERARDVVIVSLEDGGRIDAALAAALRELLLRVGLTLAEGEVGDPSTVLARVRIVLAEDGATVRAIGATSGRIETTHRVHPAESEALFRETLAHVVLGAVEPLAVAADGAPPPALAPAEKEQAGAAAARVPRSRTHFGAGLGAGPVWLGHGLWGARLFARGDAYVATRVPSAFGLTLGGVLPRERERADVQGELWLAFARVQAGLEPWRALRARLGTLLTAGADLVSVSVKTERSAERLSSPERTFSALLGGLVQMRLLLRRGVELQLAAGCDVDLKPTSFAVRDGGQRRTLFALGRARPYAGLAVAWSSL